MHHLMKETTEIWLHCNNFKRDMGFTQSWNLAISRHQNSRAIRIHKGKS